MNYLYARIVWCMEGKTPMEAYVRSIDKALARTTAAARRPFPNFAKLRAAADCRDDPAPQQGFQVI
jgi:hypothetical protein